MTHKQTHNNPTIFVMLGATGDLAQRKIIPALFNLYTKNKLPSRFKIIGFARSEYSQEEFQNFVKKALAKPSVRANKKDATKFAELFSYRSGLFDKANHYKSILDLIIEIDNEWNVCSNKLFYFAAHPEFFGTIARNLSKTGLSTPCAGEEGWTRVLVEKPFGENYTTAKKLDKLFGELFQEKQIYRIDHYLAKEMLQNILTFRFSNNLLRGSWDNKSIQKIEIRLWEKLGVENRGAFYDDIGALRDVGQNHLLQMLALATMDQPLDFQANKIREKRTEVLKTLVLPSKEEIKESTYRAQYTGYKNISGVKKNSDTETYFKMRAFLNAPLWRGVPILMESGKRLKKQVKEIVFTFKHPRPCLCPPEAGKHYRNRIKFSLEPEEKISIKFLSKIPGLRYEVAEKEFSFKSRKKGTSSQYVEEYEKLLLDCIEGDQTLFVSTEEIKAMWRFTDPIVKEWKNNTVKLDTYKADSEESIKKSEFIDENIMPGRKIRKELGIVGLGKMGNNMAQSLSESGWSLVGHDKYITNLERPDMHVANSIKELAQKLSSPRIIWLMVPVGAVDEVLFGKNGLANFLKRGDVIVDGGNSFYKDSIKRYKKLKKAGISFVDAGVSGGPDGARYGASIMIGGEKRVFKKIEPLFYDLSESGGYEFFEGAGAGHFVKMVHNGIEYGMMQAIAEGFTILKNSSYKLDLSDVAHVYNHGSVIESRLIGWLYNAFELHEGELEAASGSVNHTGTGKWTTKTAKEMGITAKIIDEAFQFRVNSEKNPSYTGKILTALRNQFGGHPLE